MREAAVVAAFYFRRMARKPVLILFLLAIPFTLLLAEFAAFGRTPSAKPIQPLPVQLVWSEHSSEGDRFASCLDRQTGHPLTIQERAEDSITISGASPIKVVTNFHTTDQTDIILASSIVGICSSQVSYPISLDRAAAAPAIAAMNGKLFFARFFPGLALFGSLFLSQAMASLVWRDQESQAQRRLLTMPISTSAMVFGPFLFLAAGAAGALVLILALCAFATNAGALLSPMFWALVTGFALCAAGLQLTVGLLVHSHRAATAMSASTNMMLAFFGGGFVPLSVYPPFLRAAAFALPNGAAQAGIVQLLQGSVNPTDLLWRVSTVWVWAAVLVCASIVLQNRRMLA